MGDLTSPANDTTSVSATDMSASIDKIAGALAKAQGELGAASKDQSGYGYNYSDLAQVISSSKDVLTKNGLSVVQLMGPTTDTTVSLTTILSHSSGQFFRSESSIPIIDMKSCNKAQQAGASLSYLRRYAYQSIIGQPSEDNDGSSKGFDKASKPAKKAAAPAKKPAAKASSGSFRKNAAPAATEGASDDL